MRRCHLGDWPPQALPGTAAISLNGCPCRSWLPYRGGILRPKNLDGLGVGLFVETSWRGHQGATETRLWLLAGLTLGDLGLDLRSRHYCAEYLYSDCLAPRQLGFTHP